MSLRDAWLNVDDKLVFCNAPLLFSKATFIPVNLSYNSSETCDRQPIKNESACFWLVDLAWVAAEVD